MYRWTQSPASFPDCAYSFAADCVSGDNNQTPTAIKLIC